MFITSSRACLDDPQRGYKLGQSVADRRRAAQESRPSELIAQECKALIESMHCMSSQRLKHCMISRSTMRVCPATCLRFARGPDSVQVFMHVIICYNSLCHYVKPRLGCDGAFCVLVVVTYL